MSTNNTFCVELKMYSSASNNHKIATSLVTNDVAKIQQLFELAKIYSNISLYGMLYS